MSAYDSHSAVERDTGGSLQSARLIVPIVLELLQSKPARVVDIGCGLGAWLLAFKENGAEVLQGLDGAYLDPAQLLIGQNQFKAVNLGQLEEIQGEWDMAICLEVVEHLSPDAGSSLIDAITRVAPVVLFSAALPGQNGRGHINLQWPAYWEQIFASNGYRRLDPIRRHIWQDNRIEWWYRQNLYLYVSNAALSKSERLQMEVARTPNLRDEWVHMSVVSQTDSLTATLGKIPQLARRALLNRLRWGHPQ